jgi:hypothetical protein
MRSVLFWVVKQRRLIAGVSGQPIDPVMNVQTVQDFERCDRNVGKSQSALHNITEEERTPLVSIHATRPMQTVG